MSSLSLTIRRLCRDEMDILIEWAGSEGWNPGLYDADSFYVADPEGFLIGEIDGEPIAMISAVKYGKTFGFVGFYIVKPDFRRKGYGLSIWNAAIEHLSGRNMGLDGVVDQQNNYKKSGFKLAYRNIRYEGLSAVKPFNKSLMTDLLKVPFETIEKYDLLFFPELRTEFLKSWINQKDSFALGILNDGKLKGYGVIRPCQSGYKIGPLFADNPELAEHLFNALNSKVKPGQPIFLDTPEVNHNAILLAENHNMKFVFETARMYTGDFPDLPVDRIFGVTTFELG